MSNWDAETLVGVSPVETRGDRFRRLYARRMARFLEDMRLLGNLSYTGNYAYIDEQVDELVGGVLSEAVTLERKFLEGAASRRA